MATVNIGDTLEYKGKKFSISESPVHRKPKHFWFSEEKPKNKEEDDLFWIFGKDSYSGVHLSNFFVEQLDDEELPKLVYEVNNLIEAEFLNEGVHLKLIHYSDDSAKYYGGYNDDYLKFIRDAIARDDKADLSFLAKYRDIMPSVRGSSVFTLPEMYKIWQNNKDTLLLKSETDTIDYQDTVSLINNIFKLEYLSDPFLPSGEIRDDFRFIDDTYNVIYVKTKKDFLEDIQAMNKTIAKHKELNESEEIGFFENKDPFVVRVWSEGPGKAYKKFLFRSKVKAEREGLIDFIEGFSPVEHFAVTEFGGHITRNAKYLKAITHLLEEHKNSLPKSRLAHRANSKTRIFNDKFLLTLMEQKSNEFLSNNVDGGYLFSTTSDDNKKIVQNSTDVNYVAAILINKFGPNQAVEIIGEAVGHSFENGVPTVSQWERYLNDYEKEGYDKLPFDWAIEIVSQKRKGI